MSIDETNMSKIDFFFPMLIKDLRDQAIISHLPFGGLCVYLIGEQLQLTNHQSTIWVCTILEELWKPLFKQDYCTLDLEQFF